MPRRDKHRALGYKCRKKLRIADSEGKLSPRNANRMSGCAAINLAPLEYLMSLAAAAILRRGLQALGIDRAKMVRLVARDVASVAVER